MLRALTRFPSSKFPQDLLTQEPVFDSYLHQLDAELLGRASLRKVTLEEVRDHLLEQQAALMDQGLAAEVAAQQALDGFGSAEELGAEQRREKTRDFFKYFIQFGLLFAVFMAVLQMVSEVYGSLSWYSEVRRFAFNFTFYGLFMSFFMTFSHYQTSATKLSSKESLATTNAIHVYTPKKYKALALIMLFFGVSMLMACVLSLLGIFSLYGLYGNLLMGYLGLFMVSAMSSGWTHLTLEGKQFHIRGLLQNRHFRIANVKEFKRQSLWRIYLPPAFGRIHKLVLLTDQGKTQTLYFSLNAEMHESDRMFSRLESMKNSQRLNALG